MIQLLLIIPLLSLLSLNLVCLNVNAIRLQPEGREKYYWSGEQFVITCQNNNNIKNVKMRWLGPDGREIIEDRSMRIHTESATPHGHRLIVMNASASDSGTYKCTMGGEGDRHAKESIEFTLHIHRSIDFDDTPARYSVQAGERAMLTCRVTFDPDAQATVTWLRDRRPIESLGDQAFSVKDYNDQTQSSLLMIRPVARQHDSTYTCRASAVTAALSQLREHDIRLDVQYAPTFDAPSRTVWVSAIGSNGHHHNTTGSTGTRTKVRKGQHHQNQQHQQQQDQQVKQQEVTLRCVAYGNPAPRLEWTSTRTGQPLMRGSPPHILDIIEGSSIPNFQLTNNNQYRRQNRLNANGSMRRHDSITSSRIDLQQQQLQQQQRQLDNRTSSILRIAYTIHNTDNLISGENQASSQSTDLDTYTCTAQNALGTAQKTFTISPGSVPPAYRAVTRRYEPTTGQLELTIYGPDIPANQQNHHLATPPVDAFRIRTATTTTPTGSTQAQASSSHNTLSGGSAQSSFSSSLGGNLAAVTFSATPIPQPSPVMATQNSTNGMQQQQQQNDKSSKQQKHLHSSQAQINVSPIPAPIPANYPGGPVAQQMARYQAALGLARSPLAHNGQQQQHPSSLLQQQQLINAISMSDTIDSELGDDYEDEVIAALAHQVENLQEPKWPVNYTLNLATLPAGQHRLYLDAHNAVGWSINSTLLGDYYIVSGSTSMLSGVLSSGYLSLCCTIFSILFACHLSNYHFIL